MSEGRRPGFLKLFEKVFAFSALFQFCLSSFDVRDKTTENVAFPRVISVIIVRNTKLYRYSKDHL